jgi:hypothetical protein
MVKRIFVMAALTLPFVLLAADRPAAQNDWVYLQNGSALRISIETYKAQKGLTPVIVSVAGAEVRAVMDGQGRVFREGTPTSAAAGRQGPIAQKGAMRPASFGVPLFVINIEKGNIQLGRETHAIRVYEQNTVRTRLMIAERTIALPLRLDGKSEAWKLRVGGLEIPARVNAAPPAVAPGRNLGARTAVGATPWAGPKKGPNAAAQLAPSRIRPRGK